ncbi:MAG TPA: M48 family metallopeptidase [Terriglobales bacterium]|nr:M48 family metallopeptidase [Terriglobales bacterium]
MKFRTVVCVLVLGFCVQFLPGAFGQNEPNPPSSASQTTQQPASQQPQPSEPAAQTQSTAPQQKQPKVKPGSKDDVNAIGDRGMGGKGLGNWYSIEKEVAMGKQYAAMIESSVKMVNDPVVSEYVNRVGQNLVRNSDAKVPFTIKVVDSDEVNAFALPGGFFYVNSGLVLAADEEAELAGVMSHEIAHVAARHATRQMTRGNMVNLASIPLIFVGGGLGYAIRSAAGLGLPLTFLRFSRGFEEEADFLGLQYMYKTGYDPQAYVTFFEKLQAKEKKKPGTLSKAFSTHPQTPDRIKRTQQEIARILPAREQYVISTSEFDDVKTRLAAIENRRKTIGPAKENQPSLRRTKKTDKTDKSGEGDRPTLQRRDDRQKQ